MQASIQKLGNFMTKEDDDKTMNTSEQEWQKETKDIAHKTRTKVHVMSIIRSEPKIGMVFRWKEQKKKH